MTVRIAMWSGPRNISTAMMRSFSARTDTFVSDEPFYGAFLQATGARQPLAEETRAAMDCDWHSVLAAQSADAPDGSAIWYQKHMPHHMVGPLSIADMPGHRHAFLIRAPERVVASYAAKNDLRTPELLGYGRMRVYFETETARLGHPPPVIDADDVLADPPGLLAKLCAALAIDWTPEMLRWRSGPHAEDGVWGAHWYGKVNASTGFAPPPANLPRLEGKEREVALACRIDYDLLHSQRLR